MKSDSNVTSLFDAQKNFETSLAQNHQFERPARRRFGIRAFFHFIGMALSFLWLRKRGSQKRAEPPKSIEKLSA